MKFKHSFIIILTASLMISCQKENTEPQTLQSASKTMLNAAYGTDPAQKMDIYLPAGRSATSTKVIVLIHGGGWTTGDKSMSTQYADTIKRRLADYAVFNINYRLSAAPLNIFPTQENDVKSAIEFIYNNRGEYNISDKFVLMGESAGAHLSMLHAYKNNGPVKMKAVVSFFGPGNLNDMYYNPVNGNPAISLGVAQAVGATPMQNSAIYTNSSPVNFISPSSGVPTIFLHGGRDALVAPAQSVALNSKLLAAGIASELIIYPAKDHGYNWDNATFFDAFNKIQVFLETQVR